MGLKQSIVVVNEYSVPSTKNGKTTGSRGATPGEYVMRYMARDLATETITPIRRTNEQDFVMRYMAREDATERVRSGNQRTLKREMYKAQGQGGVAFGYGEVSLSDEQLRLGAKDIQRLFDEGHTVLKTVLSFDEEYLRQHGIIPKDFTAQRKGDYRGHIDQMKLRMAVMHGLTRMGHRYYDDLRYVGVIQVDTMHTHVHLSMVDAGVGTVMPDGTQKGKLSPKAISILRRGMDAWLDGQQKVRHLSSSVQHERQNVTSYVKRWAHQQMLRESLPQFLIATLPADRRLWRLSTNATEMRKPNAIVKEIVTEVLERPGSPLGEAMAKVQDYANHRRDAESLSQVEWEKLVRHGRDEIIERGVNAVYASLRQMPEDVLRIRTPMLDMMGLDYEEMARRAHEGSVVRAEDEDLIGFGFRLRSFSSRMEHHTSKREEYHEKVRQWETADAAGLAAPASRALYEFYLEEEEYQARCAAKYRHFLSFAPPVETWYEDWDRVADYGERLLSLESMRKDQSLRKMKDLDEAERVGREVYGQAGGHLVAQGDKRSLEQLESRVRKMRVEYARKVYDMRVAVAGKGLKLSLEKDEDTGADVPHIEQGEEFPFAETKGLDMHHMRYDFSDDVEVGPLAMREYTGWARRRSQALQKAVDYLESTKQAESVVELPVYDVTRMIQLSNAMELDGEGGSMLPSEVAKLRKKRELLRRSRTVALTYQLSETLTNVVDQSVANDALREMDQLPGAEVDGRTLE